VHLRPQGIQRVVDGIDLPLDVVDVTGLTVNVNGKVSAFRGLAKEPWGDKHTNAADKDGSTHSIEKVKTRFFALQGEICAKNRMYGQPCGQGLCKYLCFCVRYKTLFQKGLVNQPSVE
jgi:hypothetical protein